MIRKIEVKKLEKIDLKAITCVFGGGGSCECAGCATAGESAGLGDLAGAGAPSIDPKPR